MNKMIEAIEIIHQDAVCLFKIGSFYHVYGRDSYILSYLLGYKVKEDVAGNRECGFPINALNKVEKVLENKRINYLVIDSRNNYYVENEMDFNNLNVYSNIYSKSKKVINYKQRINNIYNFLIENMNKDENNKMIRSIEEIVFEGR